MRYRPATLNDLPLLAEFNHQLIRDEGHRNPMTVPELAERMRGWLTTAYKAVIFENETDVLAYALYRENDYEIYLRQFFVVRTQRHQGVGRQAMQLLLNDIWPKHKRLTVEVLWNNKPAVEFWKSVGFQEYCLALEILPES
jgi:ribosomal protein S18 acetylase RimI-like enzyme